MSSHYISCPCSQPGGKAQSIAEVTSASMHRPLPSATAITFTRDTRSPSACLLTSRLSLWFPFPIHPDADASTLQPHGELTPVNRLPPVAVAHLRHVGTKGLRQRLGAEDNVEDFPQAPEGRVQAAPAHRYRKPCAVVKYWSPRPGLVRRPAHTQPFDQIRQAPL